GSVGYECEDAALVDRVDVAEPLDVAIEDRDLGLHPLSDPGSVRSGHAGAEDDDPGGMDAGDAAHQHPPAPVALLEQARPHLGCHPPGNLAQPPEQPALAVRG